MRRIMVKIARERNTCEKKALLSSIACDLFVLICQRNWVTCRVSRISQISLSQTASIEGDIAAATIGPPPHFVAL
jgi:hypothetical protein